MKSKSFATMTALAVLNWAVPIQAQTVNPIDQLRVTRACQGCNLTNANLKGLDLSNTDLKGATLSNADLSNANLSNANLSGANLYLAKFSNANLSGANISGVNAKSATLGRADLSGSNLADGNFSYASLTGANLSQADLSRADFSDADLNGANLNSANPLDTNLSHAKLSGANLAAVKFSGTNLLGADLSAANLNGADLAGAKNVATANLKDASLVQATLPTPGSQPPTASSGNTGSTDSATNAATAKSGDILSDTKFEAKDSSLANIPFQRPTAQHLKAGELALFFSQRYFFTSGLSSEVTQKKGTPFWTSAGLRWGITNSTEFGLAYQAFDPVSIGTQGPFRINIEDSTPTWDFALELKQKIWENKSKTQTLSGVVSVAGFTEPTFNFISTPGPLITRKGNGFVPSLAFPFTAKVNNRLNLTVSPTVAFFPSDSALYLHTLPIANPGSFGTTFGLTGAVSYQISPRLLLWGDVFMPFTGNNSVSVDTGLPKKVAAFNAGIRYLLNPKVGLDVYATNTFGTLGPLALTAEPQNIGIGANLVFMPDIIPANRSNNPNNFEGQFNRKDTPLTTDGLGFFDGGTVPSGRVLTQFQGGNKGVMGAVRYGVVKDLELGAYLDYVFGKVDESEQGISAKLRFLNQAEGAPFTMSAVATLGQGNELIFNLAKNNAKFWEQTGQDKSIPFLFSGRLNKNEAALIATVSLPLQYQFSPGTAIWFTPTLGFVQRSGIDIAGATLGGSYRVFKDVSLIGEVGANFGGKGNAFVGNRLVDKIPWTAAVRWEPSNLLGIDFKDELVRPSFDVFVTNRVGASSFQQLRVLNDNDIAVGVGVSIPF